MQHVGSSSLTRGRTRALHPGSEVSWSWNYQGGSSVLFLKESVNVVPPSLPWETVLVASRYPCLSFFPLLQASWFCHGRSWAASPEPGRRQFSSQAPPLLRGGWERAWGPSLWEDICWGSFPGKAVFLFFLQAPFPVSWDLPSLNLMLRTQQPSEKVQTRERANCRESVGGAEVAESQQDPVPKSDLSESLNHTRS